MLQSDIMRRRTLRNAGKIIQKSREENLKYSVDKLALCGPKSELQIYSQISRKRKIINSEWACLVASRVECIINVFVHLR
jgi:hypothetical protein